MSISDFDQKKFMKTVRQFMKRNELSVRTFAKMAKVSFVNFYRWENDSNEISFAALRKIEKAMEKYEGLV